MPLSLLKTSAAGKGPVTFNPVLPSQFSNALDKMEMGKVIRIVLRFRERFWESIHDRNGSSLSDLSFLFSQDEWFPTWWTNMPRKDPIIMGWAPFRSAERLSGQTDSFAIEHALKSLAKTLNASYAALEKLLDKSYLHDWQSDPLSCGAYSYGKVRTNPQTTEMMDALPCSTVPGAQTSNTQPLLSHRPHSSEKASSAAATAFHPSRFQS